MATISHSKMQLENLAHSETCDSLLLREMHHRMADTLTLLVGALWNEFGSSTTPGIRDSLARCEARIVAFGRLHRLLIVGARAGPIAVPMYVDSLCRALSEAVLKPAGVRCEVSASAGVLPAETCERLGLVIAELVTNAARHAFNGRKDKVVRVELSRTSSRWHCIVSDNGTGTKASEPGAGSRVLDELVRPTWRKVGYSIWAKRYIGVSHLVYVAAQTAAKLLVEGIQTPRTPPPPGPCTLTAELN